jgi:hypothetical protein
MSTNRIHMHEPTPSSTIRARHFRQRQKRGIRVVLFELLPAEIEALVSAGLIASGQTDDRIQLGAALERVVGDWVSLHRRSS